MRILYWGAINPLTGRPYTWGDPNLRWGNPSYALEPGDAGFVPYPLETQNKPSKHTMTHRRWYPVRLAEQLVWLGNFASKLAGHAAALGLSPADCAARIADARWLIYYLGSYVPAARAWLQSVTQSAEAAQFGAGGPFVMPVFVPPALPGATTDPVLPAVVPVPEGALERIFDTVNDVRNQASMQVQEDLRITGVTMAGPDFETFGPKLKVTKTATGIEIDWGWQGYRDFLDQCEIEVDRGDGQGWRLLTIDTTPGYKDSHPFPAQLAKWKYRAIYRVGDQQVGQWSASTPAAEVSVGG